jgi:HEPN domain-containing protein
MRRPEVEARRWLAQAQSDLAFAEIGVREGFYAQACFICQQAGEKALKAIHYRRGARLVLGHSLTELLHDLLADQPALGELRDAARQLDQYYIPTRYPNGLPGGVPAEAFTAGQAAEAVSFARRLLARAAAALDDSPR